MSQHGLSIANQAFPSFRTDLNSALLALKSMNSGTSAPSSPVAGMLWYDTGSSLLKMYNGTVWENTPAPSTVDFAALTADAIANQTEAETGTATDKLMTAERVAQAITALGGAGLKHTFVGRSGTQSISTSTLTKVEFNSASGDFVDTESWFDTTTNHRFQPTEAGSYLVTFNWSFNSGVDGVYTYASLYKNGSAHTPLFWGLSQYGGSIKVGHSAQYVVPMNGTSDYLETYVWHNFGSNANLVLNTGDTRFTAVKLSS